MNTMRSLILILMLIASLSPGSALASSGKSPLLVVPANGFWTGTTSRNHPMSFTVQSGGTQWSTFKLKTDYNATTCGVTGTMELTIFGPGNIFNSQFSVSSGNGFSASGQFTSSTNATGTFSFSNYPIQVGLCTYFFNQSGTWTASTASPPTSGKLVLESTGTLDGWILESSETSNQGGTLNAAAPTFVLGDHASNRQFRAILSFCPGGLPFDATVTKAVLKIKKVGVVGTDPFTTHKKIAIDLRQGAFSNNLALQLNDFKAVASMNGAGVISNNPQAGNWYVASLKPNALPFIRATSCIQLRLRFQLDDNNDLGADFLKFYSGDASPNFRPRLILTYTTP
jgi:hypothetical protein